MESYDITHDGAVRPLHERWVEQLLGVPVPEEPEATCDDCVMCAPTGVDAGEQFNPRTKCCTFHPDLPNFLVGRALAAEVGAASLVAERVEAGVDATPLRLASPGRFDVIFRHAQPAWGKSLAQRCPYYDEAAGGRCGVWASRASVCATWFCKHTRGELGRRFWEALKHCLGSAEVDLALWCALQLDLDAPALDRLLTRVSLKGGPQLGASELDGFIEQGERRRRWGKWCGREVEYYKRCAELVEPLSWSEIQAICGVRTAAWAQVTVEAHRKLQDRGVPTVLRFSGLSLNRIDVQTVQICTYSATDPLELPRELIDALPYFDGARTTELVQRAIASERDLEIDDALLRLLVDFQVLTAAENET